MSEATVVFTLEGTDLTMQCSSEEKMRDICQKYATKIDKNMGSLLFLYEGNKVNFDLTFREQAGSSDGNKNEIKIMVRKFELKDITSEFFLLKLFSNIKEKIKLKLINYNKKLQKINDITLYNYKYFSDSYITYETGTKGKQFNRYFNNLEFEGDYLKGKRNGKGKEYDSEGKKRFEGEYLNGKRHGYGKEYIFYKLRFEGEYLKGERNGKGKEYDLDTGKLIFEGEYLNGKRWNGKGYDENGNIIYELNNGNGKVKEYFNRELIFEGEYLNGERNGKGKEYHNGKLRFDGIYLNGKRWNGKGYDNNGNIIYELNNNKGKVIEYNIYDELIFEGEYLNGKINGKGKKYNDSNNKLEFEGEYLNGKRWNGKLYDYNKDLIYELKDGKGKVKLYYYNIL